MGDIFVAFRPFEWSILYVKRLQQLINLIIPTFSLYALFLSISIEPSNAHTQRKNSMHMEIVLLSFDYYKHQANYLPMHSVFLYTNSRQASIIVNLNALGGILIAKMLRPTERVCECLCLRVSVNGEECFLLL